MRSSKLLLLFSLATALSCSTLRASLLFLYDFPGSPGSGLAANQSFPQPTGATFGDFTRTADLGVVSSAGGNNTFGTNNWNQTGVINPAQYEGFTITANVGLVLNLTSLTFEGRISSTGPANAEVALFLNGSATAYATFDFAPPDSSSFTAFAFNFTPLTDADNVTSATFLFYGWNAGGPGGQFYLDNVATYGVLSSVPEASSLWPLIPVFVCVFFELTRAQRRRGRKPGSTVR